MDLQAIAQDIVKAVKENSLEWGGEPLENFQDQYSDYLREHMPYDVRILEPRDYQAENEVRSIVEQLLEADNN